MQKKYKAFISYSHADIAFARWLQKSIENYKIPKKLREKYPHLPKDLKRSIFRDEEELPTSSALPINLTKALEESEFLIVIASPYAVNSKWVNKEINHFNNYHKNGKVLAIIKAGEPYAKEGQLEAFPHALTEDKKEPIAGDARSFLGRKRALMKVIAGLLEVDFADLWEREKKESRKRKIWMSSFLTLFIFVSTYALFQFQGNTVNSELVQIKKQIRTIEYELHHTTPIEEIAITLNEKLKKLKEERENKEASLEALGRLETSIGKEANRVYQEKGAEEAIKILTAKESIAKREEKRKELADESITLAKLYIETYNFIKAKEAYEEAIKLFVSFKNIHEYARFLNQQKEPEKAIKLYHTLNIKDLLLSEKMKMLTSLALIYDDNNQLKESEESYTKVLKLYQEHPNILTDNYTATLDNMGNLYRKTNRLESAIASHNKALEIEQRQEEKEPKKYRLNIFITLNNLGNAYKEINQFKKSEECYSRALVLIRELVKEEPNKYRGKLALLLFNLSSIYNLNKKIVKGSLLFDESLQLVRVLAKENPVVYKEELAESLYISSIRYFTNNQPKKSDKALKESLELSRVLFNKNPNLYSKLLSQVFQMYGLKYIIQSHPQKALDSFKETLKVIEILKDSHPDLYQERSGDAYIQLSKLYFSFFKNPKKAEESIVKALEFYTLLAKKHPQKFNQSVADVLEEMANIYVVQKQFNKAEEAHIKSVQFYQELADKNPNHYNYNLVSKLHSLARFYGEIDQFEKAENSYNKALKLQRALAKKYPKLYQKGLPVTLWRFSSLYMKKHQNFPKGEKLLLEAIEIQEELVKQNPILYTERLSIYLDSLADAYLIEKTFQKAEEILLKALKSNNYLIELNSKKYNEYLAKSLYSLASLYHKRKETNKANEYYIKALKYYRKSKSLTLFSKSNMAKSLEVLAQNKEQNSSIVTVEKLYLEALSIRNSISKEEFYFLDLDRASLIGNIVDFYQKKGQKEEAKRLFTEELKSRRALSKKYPDKFNAWGLGLTALKGVKNFSQPLSLLDEAKEAMLPFKGEENIDRVFKWIQEVKKIN